MVPEARVKYRKNCNLIAVCTEEMRDRLDALADSWQMTRSEALRQIISDRLEAEKR